jgi:lactate dehydrogenase-like 2-hydroxyacid dehydrogenase
MDIGYHQRTKKPDLKFKYYENLLDMAKECEILVAIIPGGEATKGLINESIIEAIGPTGLLVNVARGTVVDNEALARCLKDGRIGGAALDVFPEEPNVPKSLLKIETNLILTPHMASATHLTRMKMGMILYDNLEALTNGTPFTTLVN